MRFGLRMALWAIGAAVEHLLLLALGTLAAAAAVVVVTAVAGSLVARALLPGIERGLDRGWSAAVAPLSSLADEQPSTPLNQTAARLETIAATLGFDLAPPPHPNRPHPGPDAVAAFQAIKPELLTILRCDPSSDTTVQTFPAYHQWREGNREAIGAAAAVLVDGDPPQWESGLVSFPGGPHTDLEGQLWLHRVLVAEAWLTALAGDLAGAGHDLEASWRLARQLLACPQPEIQQVALAVFELQAAVLRRAPFADPTWQERLRSFDPTLQARRAYLYLTWSQRRRAATIVGDHSPVLALVAQPLARLLVIPHSRAMQQAVSDLGQRSPVGFDPMTFAAEQFVRVARSNTLSRSALPVSWQLWLDALRARLMAELTWRVLAVRELALREGLAATTELPTRQPSLVAGVEWVYEVAGGRVEIRLEPEPFGEDARFPLRETITLDVAKPSED